MLTACLCADYIKPHSKQYIEQAHPKQHIDVTSLTNMGLISFRVLAVNIVMILFLGRACGLPAVKMSVDKKSKDGAVKFAFAKHFQNHMVLQKAPAKANVYGFSPTIGQEVLLEVTPSPVPRVYKTTVKPGPAPGVGAWSFTLDPAAGNTSVSIKVTSGGVSLTLSDVLFGDVWLCSGQSNMEFTVIQMEGAAKELADAHNYPHIRLMTVDNAQSSTPLYDLGVIRQPWTTPSNVSLGGPIWTYFSAICWLYGKALHKALGYPIGLVDTDYGGTPVEAWSSHKSLAKCGVDMGTKHREEDDSFVRDSHKMSEDRLGGPGNNSVLWNAMVYPLIGMTIKGAIWYQGESDASGTRLTHYNCTFPSMIQDWRYNFHDASGGQTDLYFPFGFVQLAGYRPNATTTRGFPDIRWHQTADRGYVPNTDMVNVFMAVAMDLPGFNSSYGPIHPQYKKDVADRLTLAGLSVAYGKNLVYQGPFPERHELTSGGLVISYGNRWKITVRSTQGFVLLCVSGTRRTWTPTTIQSNNQTSVTLKLTCGSGQHISTVRYAWTETPCEFKKCAVYESINQLPGPPFELNLSAGGTFRH